MQRCPIASFLRAAQATHLRRITRLRSDLASFPAWLACFGSVGTQAGSSRDARDVHCGYGGCWRAFRDGGAHGHIPPRSWLEATAVAPHRRHGGTWRVNLAVWQRHRNNAPAAAMDMPCSALVSRQRALFYGPVARRRARACIGVGCMHPRSTRVRSPLWRGALPRWSACSCICGGRHLPPYLGMASHCGHAPLLCGSGVCCLHTRAAVALW